MINAAIDDVGFWRRVVTPQEVAAIYDKGSSGSDLTTASVGIVVPPSIVVQPQGQLVSAGASVTLTVAASGTPLNFQWQKNSANVVGQTGSNLTFSAVQSSDTGDYRVTITQSYRLYHALRDNGVTTQFIAYPLSGHSPSDPVHIRDVDRRWVEWLAKYIGS